MKMIREATTLCIFLAAVIQNVVSQYVYPCSVANCQVCTYNNFCGLCNSGYML